MTKYLFQLGVMKELSFAELEAVLGKKLQKITDNIILVELPDKTPIADLMQKLGGTIKIMQLVQTLSATIDEEKLKQALITYFLSLKETKIHFALGEIGRNQIARIDLINLKSQLIKAGLKIRYHNNARQGANAALLLNYKKLIELVIIQNEKNIYLGHTVAVQDINDWTLRDRAKPYADHKKGMLPPKLARMMVNLAVGQNESTQLSVYDPFCGTGTVLLEGAFYNFELFGSDIDNEAVIGSKENLKWLAETYMIETKEKIFTQDATTVKLAQLGKEIDFIVTEPFLGKQTPKSQELANVFKGLEKLYLGAFKNWRSLLKDGAKVIIVWPQVEADNHQLFTVDHLLDKLQAIGYTKKSNNLIYARPRAIVKREVCVFEYRQIKTK